MPQELDFDSLVKPLEELLLEVTNKKLSLTDFQPQFDLALKRYENKIGDRAYSPLSGIRDNCLKWSRMELRQNVEQALERLPQEALDRSTRLWFQDNLIEGGYAEHLSHFDFHKSEQSKFGHQVELFSTPIDKGSFLVSALNGTLKPLSFVYSDLLKILKGKCLGNLATWVYGIEPDNAIAIIEWITSLGDPFSSDVDILGNSIERNPAPEGGMSYLMLLPKDKDWMLLHVFDYHVFSIQLHGNKQFLSSVHSQLTTT